MKPATAVQHSQFVRFVAAGALAAAVNFGSRFFYSLFSPFEYAVLFAFITGLTTGYLLSRFFVFDRGRHSTAKEMLLFVAVNMVALAQTWLLSIYLADYLLDNGVGSEMAYATAHLMGIIFPVITSYIGHKYFTFKA